MHGMAREGQVFCSSGLHLIETLKTTLTLPLSGVNSSNLTLEWLSTTAYLHPCPPLCLCDPLLQPSILVSGAVNASTHYDSYYEKFPNKTEAFSAITDTDTHEQSRE